MALFTGILTIAVLGVVAFYLAQRVVVYHAQMMDTSRLHALPSYYGWCAVLWSMLPSLGLFYLFHMVAVKSGIMWLTHPVTAVVFAAVIMLSAVFLALIALSPRFNARVHAERWLYGLLLLCTALSVAITVLIIASVAYESWLFFQHVPVSEFLFGLQWSPQTAIRADQAGSSGAFGAVPVFTGTLLITFVAMCIAGPIGLLSAIYLSEYASKRFRDAVKPVLEVLAGVPTVVYGYFAVITFAPFLRTLGDGLGLEVASESALSAGIVMGVMIIPFVLSLSDDVMNAVPAALREASLGLGATRSETIKRVVIPAALPGIMGALLLAISRGIGETMIVVMAAGLAANLTANPLESVTTVTAQIVTLLVGDQEFDSAKTLSAFALGLTLFIITLLLNVIAMVIVKKYREQYE